MVAIVKYVRKSDIAIFNFFNDKINCTILDKIMKKITHLGSLLFSFMLPVILIFANRESFKRAGLEIALTSIISSTVVQTIKRLVNRPRPYKVLNCNVPGKVPSCQYSFPSGHSCAAFSAAFVLASIFASLSFVFIIIAAAVAISRVYLGYHYPTDIVVGTLIAYMSYIISMRVF